MTIQLARLGPLRLVAPPSADIAAPLALVALGVLPTREALHVNWREVGNLLIAGTPGAATSTVLTSILTGITARRHPSALSVIIVAAPDTLPAPLHALPNLARPIVDRRDRAEMLTLLDELTADLDRRAAGAPQPSPELLLVLNEVTTAPEEALLPLLERGPAHGIHVLGATIRPEATDDAFVRTMHTVLALQLPDEDQSVRLVGTPDAGTLDNGELLARIEGRAPVRLRAFKVEDRHLERLVEQMRAAYRVDAQRPPIAPEPAPVDEIPEAPGPNGCDEKGEAGGASPQDRGTPPASPDTGSSPLEAPAAIDVAARQDAADTERSPLRLDASPATAASEGDALASLLEAVNLEAPTPVAAKSPLICIRCFGSLHVPVGERELACMQQYQAWELLAYLATHGASVTRQEIFDTFWPGVEDAVAGNRLDNLVHRLKKVLTSQAGGGARDILCREQGRLALHGAVIDADVQRFDALLKRLPQQSPEQAVATMEAALALAGDDLLADADYGWLEQPGEDGLRLRERYAEQVAKLTHDLACRYRDSGDVDRAVALFQHLLAAQPTLQPAARGLYRCYAMRKGRQALEQAHALLAEALREARDAAGTDGTEFQLHPKTVAAYKQAVEEIQAALATQDSSSA